MNHGAFLCSRDSTREVSPPLTGAAAHQEKVDATASGEVGAAAHGDQPNVTARSRAAQRRRDHRCDKAPRTAVRAGARGYLVKGAEQEEIVRAITTVAAGGVVFGAALARRIADFFASGPPAPSVAFPQLTPREREILEMVAAGRSNVQIASALYLSPKTVRNNVSSIFAKLQVVDRAEAIVRAREAGLGR
nr:response regulator transcription factor [Planosporangium thailandense]